MPEVQNNGRGCGQQLSSMQSQGTSRLDQPVVGIGAEAGAGMGSSLSAVLTFVSAILVVAWRTLVSLERLRLDGGRRLNRR